MENSATLRLCDIKPGQCAYICSLDACRELCRRLTDIGLIENTPVECVGISPCGDPAAFLIRGAVIAIRRSDSRNIYIRDLPPRER